MHRNNEMEKKVKVTFVLPEALQRDLKERIVMDGYDLKGKSKWVVEAIEKLFLFDNFAYLVKLNDEMKGLEKSESIVIDRSFKAIMNEAMVRIRKEYPALEGVQSRIVRTAIVQRLIRTC